MDRHLTASEARQRFLELIDEVLAGDQVIVTKRGTPAVVLIDFERLETLKSVARLWQDPEALRAMRQANEDLAKGKALRTRGEPRVHALIKAARARAPACLSSSSRAKQCAILGKWEVLASPRRYSRRSSGRPLASCASCTHTPLLRD